jgi:hypothetical protein
MIELKLTPSHFEELIKKGYSLDLIFILKCVEGEVEEYGESPKIKNLEDTALRKGLIGQGGLTEEGKQLIAFLSSTTSEVPNTLRKREKKIVVENGFDKWWKAFPGTDTFEYRGKKFKGTRAIRVKKDDCRIKIDKILAEGEYTIDELVEALKLEIQQKMENSLKTGQNKLSYMQNSLTYLHQRTFEPYLELIKSGHKVEETSKIISYGGISI